LVLKDVDVTANLEIVFITGVSRFSRVSIFSELNNLDDITMSQWYATLCGYTQTELEEYFSQHIARFVEFTGMSQAEVMEKLRQRYNGYRFSKRKELVYNPFSILKSLNEVDFGNYWFETGTPTFLVNILRERGYNLPELDQMVVDEAMFSNYDIERFQPEALLLQTGYVTIHDIQGELYHLGYPNHEVKFAFLKFLYFSFTEGLTGNQSSQFLYLSRYLYKEDFESFFETIKSIFAGIPYMLNAKKDEAYFHTLFYLMVVASGANAQCEVLTSRGRIDLVAQYPDKLFIIEFKCNQDAETALQQIKDKGYVERYSQTGKQIYLIGVDFNTETRNVSEWKIERI
jgi:hypothetical protein